MKLRIESKMMSVTPNAPVISSEVAGSYLIYKLDGNQTRNKYQIQVNINIMCNGKNYIITGDELRRKIKTIYWSDKRPSFKTLKEKIDSYIIKVKKEEPDIDIDFNDLSTDEARQYDQSMDNQEINFISKGWSISKLLFRVQKVDN